jgi:hypothetical protein
MGSFFEACSDTWEIPEKALSKLYENFNNFLHYSYHPVQTRGVKE